MRKTIAITYSAIPVRTAQMFVDPAYQKTRVSRARSDNTSADVAQCGQGLVATVVGSIQPSQLPSVTSRLVCSVVALSVVESWGEPKDDSSRSGGYGVAVKNVPVKVSATSTMSPTGEATTVIVNIDLKVTVSLVGEIIEEKAVGMMGRAVADEERRAATWLAGH